MYNNNNNRGGGGGGGRGRGGGKRNYQQPAQPFGYPQQPGFPPQQQQQLHQQPPSTHYTPQSAYQNHAGGYFQTQQFPQQPHHPQQQQQHGGGILKKTPKMASHVVYNPSMLFNCSQVSQLPASPLSGCTLLFTQPHRVQVFLGSMDGMIQEFQYDSGVWKRAHGIQLEGVPTCVLAVEGWLFVGFPNSRGGQIKAFDLTSGRDLSLLDAGGVCAHLGVVSCLEVGNQMLISGGGDGLLKAWRLHAGQWALVGIFTGASNAPSAPLPLSSSLVCCKTISANMIASGSQTGEIKVWVLTDGALVAANPAAHQGSICALDVLAAPAPNGPFLLSFGGEDCTVRLWTVYLQMMYQIPVGPPPGKPLNPGTAMKVFMCKGSQHLFLGFRNGSIQVLLLKDPTRFDRMGLVDGHQRMTKVLGFGAVPTGDSAQMICTVMENGNVNWFNMEA